MTQIKITPDNSKKLLDLNELWRFRELFYIFVWRDLKVRYKQTVIGVLWVVLQPLITMVIFTILFGNIAKIPSGNIPYNLFIFSGLVYWTFFQTALSESIESIITNQNIVKKIYFPRVILVFSSVLNRVVDFLINFIILLIFSFFSGFRISFTGIFVLFFALLVTVILASGVGLYLSALNVKYRDIRYIHPFLFQIAFYLTPIVYPLSVMSDRNRFLISLNPMTGIMETVRWVFSESPIMPFSLLSYSVFLAIIIFIFGAWHFNRTQD